MTISQKVLIIGAPFVYDLVDNELLKKNLIEPFYLFKDNDAQNAHSNIQKIIVKDLTLQQVKKATYSNKIDSIVCYNDLFLLEVAKIRSDLNLPGIKFDDMNKFKCKSVMNDILKEFIKTIPFIFLNDDLSYSYLTKAIGSLPYFVKPDNSAGTEGTVKIDSEEQFNAVIKGLDLNTRDYIIQPYMDGKLFHCELMVQNGEVIYSQARRYSYPNYNILSGKVIASFPITNKNSSHYITKLAKDVQNLLGFKNGIMHTEFFQDDDEYVFLETNIRPAGGGINLIHKNHLGISLETAMILLEMGKKIDYNFNNKKKYTSGYIPKRRGVVSKFDYPKFKGKIEFNERVKVGEICYNPTSASDVAISYVGEYDSIQDMEDDFKQIEALNLIEYSSN